MEYLLLLLGFTFLIFSGRLLISGSVSIAQRLNLSPFLIGLTIVAIGTSAPELLVSLTGAIKGHTDVAVYNIVGSNISNILLVLAVAAIILPIPVKSRIIWFDGSFMMLFSLLAWFFLRDLRFSSIEGVFILTLLVLFITMSVIRSRRDAHDDIKVKEPGMKAWVAVLYVIAASGGLALGANLLVDNAVSIAREIGLSERIISVSMIALGTSIPELTTSAIAAFRKQTDISIGNILGSNIFNIGLVLGVTTMVKPIDANPLILSFDIFWFVGAAVFLIFILLLPPKSLISRWKGLTMLLVYLIYLYLILK
jgi:cation:H+ antiporter